jgi:RNA polymerase sporulation-specific sigma factor
MLIIDDCLQTNSDEALCAAVAAGDRIAEETLVMRYNRLVRVCARPFFLVGGDSEDLIQEGMIGLFKAIRDYKPEENVSFRTFATVCIQRQIKTALKLAARKKHIPLNSSLSLQSSKFDDKSDKELIDYFEDLSKINPEEIYISNETYSQLNKLLYDSLSKLELNILLLYNQNLSYKEISQITDKSVKSIDNAIQRIKKKVEVIKKQYMSL